MAEIRIEKKSPVWPWIVLILILIGVLIYMFAFSGDDDDTDDPREDRTEQSTENSVGTALNNSTVADYVRFINDDPDGMGLDHEFTNEALSKLIGAVNAVADGIDYDIRKDIAQVKMNAEKITSDPFETTHANSIRKSADILADAMQNIQRKAFPGLGSAADEVKSAARDIDPDVLTLDQKDAVRNFFGESAHLLEKMNTNAPQTKSHVRKQ